MPSSRATCRYTSTIGKTPTQTERSSEDGFGPTMSANIDPPRLSICIPTYNFGRFIGEALSSMLCQMQPGVEIVVLDSGSTDETQAVLQQLQRQHDCLRNEREEQRHGIDRDMARVVQLARGDYCWLFSADDVMKEGALARVLAEIEEGRDVYICMHSNDTLSMQPIDTNHPVLDLTEDASFHLASVDEQMRYFRLAVSTEALFSFMGGLIVKRSAWESVPLNEAFVGTCWAHVARLFELIPSGLNVKFISTVLLRRRGDNDSFATHGVVRRYALAIQGYQRLGEHFWGHKSHQAFHIRRVLRYEFRLRMFLAAKLLCRAHPTTEDRLLLDDLVTSVYSDWSLSAVSKRIVFRIFPVVLVGPTRLVYRFFRGSARASDS
jgi:abequosyltransferase